MLCWATGAEEHEKLKISIFKSVDANQIKYSREGSRDEAQGNSGMFLMIII